MASLCCSSRTKIYLFHGTMRVSITVVFIFCLTVLLLPTKSGGSGLFSSTERDDNNIEESMKVIGSRPPSCVNKCMKCRPCLATPVAPDHQRKKNSKGFKVWSRGGEDDDDPYYLLSWKCACGDKLFQP